MAEKISVIIPQFGQSELTVRCVESLLRHHPEPCCLEVLIVDDGSPQSEVQNIQAHNFPRTTLIRNFRNCGVTASWNRGAELATGENLIFLNNDVISEGKWCQQLVAAIECSPASIAGPEMRMEPQLPEPMCPLFPKRQFLSGWCFAISRALLRDLGRFDLRYRLYFSDTDLQLQIALRDGDSKFIQEVADLPLIHLSHQTTRQLPDRSAQWLVDRDEFLKKWKL